jgi:hypothetical protein
MQKKIGKNSQRMKQDFIFLRLIFILSFDIEPINACENEIENFFGNRVVFLKKKIIDITKKVNNYSNKWF